MKVLSLFDGIGCARIALDRAGFTKVKYYASEIDKPAMRVTNYRYPDVVQLGDVTTFNDIDFPKIDLMIGGSPCQGFSHAGRGLNFNDPRSKLFFSYVYLLKALKPRYFLLENVKMRKEWEDVITNYMGVEPIEIDSALVSAQQRRRLYWTNIPGVQQPKDKGIKLKDIVLSGTIVKESLIHSDKAIAYMNRKAADGRTHWDFAHHSDIRSNKSATVVANFFKGVPYNVLKDWDCIRKFHPVECERLQTIPDYYTMLPRASDTQRYRMIGNAFTVDVIAHILSYIK